MISHQERAEYIARLTVELVSGVGYYVVDWDGERVAGPFATALDASRDIDQAEAAWKRGYWEEP